MFLLLESLKSSSISFIIKSMFIIIRFFSWFLIILPFLLELSMSSLYSFLVKSIYFDHLFILLRITEVIFSYIFNDFLIVCSSTSESSLNFFPSVLFCDGPLCYYCNNKWRLILMKITLTFLDTSSFIVTWFFVIFHHLIFFITRKFLDRFQCFSLSFFFQYFFLTLFTR